MTVAEHLHFFANVKGFGGWEVWDRIDRMLTDIGLADKRHALSTSLSGGMKRKLSLAIALIGDPKFVLLDEVRSLLVDLVVGAFSQSSCDIFQ